MWQQAKDLASGGLVDRTDDKCNPAGDRRPGPQREVDITGRSQGHLRHWLVAGRFEREKRLAPAAGTSAGSVAAATPSWVLRQSRAVALRNNSQEIGRAISLQSSSAGLS